jgi:hypothetical protein
VDAGVHGVRGGRQRAGWGICLPGRKDVGRGGARGIRNIGAPASQPKWLLSRFPSSPSGKRTFPISTYAAPSGTCRSPGLRGSGEAGARAGAASGPTATASARAGGTGTGA